MVGATDPEEAEVEHGIIVLMKKQTQYI